MLVANGLVILHDFLEHSITLVCAILVFSALVSVQSEFTDAVPDPAAASASQCSSWNLKQEHLKCVLK